MSTQSGSSRHLNAYELPRERHQRRFGVATLAVVISRNKLVMAA
jgi:hypothetical protein